jgi:hypothetical protein
VLKVVDPAISLEYTLLRPGSRFLPDRAEKKANNSSSALTRAKRLEQVIKLRITLNIIAERSLGAEVAMLRFLPDRAEKKANNSCCRSMATSAPRDRSAMMFNVTESRV